MKVFLTPPANMSKAMFRVAKALRRSAPPEFDIVDRSETADLLVHHVIGPDAVEYKKDRACVVLQYCGSHIDPKLWEPLWSRAVLVWSYYDLADRMPRGAAFYRAPLGIDAAFLGESIETTRDIGVMTSGFVTGSQAEAIEEVAWAANFVGLPVAHLGPKPVGLTRGLPKAWAPYMGISDTDLAALYRRCRWVSGLRHVEGFEMPVIEGLACGARPIIFDRPEMRDWYDGHAVFIPEVSGDELIDILVQVLSEVPSPVSLEERAAILAQFNWETIAAGFWQAVSLRLGVTV